MKFSNLKFEYIVPFQDIEKGDVKSCDSAKGGVLLTPFGVAVVVDFYWFFGFRLGLGVFLLEKEVEGIWYVVRIA